MPQNVRNFWLTVDVDGKRTPIACGPKAKDGGFTLTVQQRHAGEVTTAGVLVGRATTDGRIVLQWENGRDMGPTALNETTR